MHQLPSHLFLAQEMMGQEVTIQEVTNQEMTTNLGYARLQMN